MRKRTANADPLLRSGTRPILCARKGGVGERVKRVVALRRTFSTSAHQSGFRFRDSGSVSMSQNKVVAVKAVDAVEIRIDTMATLLVFPVFNRAVSWRTRL
jgi:hypothetical protein